MERNFDLICELLIFFEKSDGKPVKSPPIDGFNELEIGYHLVLLYEAGFLQCEPTRSTTSDRIISVLPFELTWDGQEFPAKIRNKSTWEKIKATLRDRGVNAAFSIISALATQLAKQSLE